MPIREIARRTGHDRKTIRKAISEPLQSERAPRRRSKRKIDPYVPYLLERVEAGVLNVRKLYQEIRELELSRDAVFHSPPQVAHVPGTRSPPSAKRTNRFPSG